MKRRRLLLFLLLLLVGAIGYGIYATPRQARVSDASTGGARPGARRGGEAAVAAGIQLRTDLLDETPRPFAGVKRDLFYGEPPVVVAPPPKVVAPPPVEVAPPPPPPPPPPTEQELMRMELGRFTFLGYLEKEGRRTVFLRAEGEPFVVRQGDRFGNRKQFYVVSLAPTRMEVRAGDNPQLYPIALVEQEALAPGRPAAGPGNPPSPAGSPAGWGRPSGMRVFGAPQQQPPEGDGGGEPVIEPEPAVEQGSEPPQVEGQNDGTQE